MNRRVFFKQICQITAVAVVAPQVLAQPAPPKEIWMTINTMGSFDENDSSPYIVMEGTTSKLDFCGPIDNPILIYSEGVVVRELGKNYE